MNNIVQFKLTSKNNKEIKNHNQNVIRKFKDNSMDDVFPVLEHPDLTVDYWEWNDWRDVYNRLYAACFDPDADQSKAEERLWTMMLSFIDERGDKIYPDEADEIRENIYKELEEEIGCEFI